MSGRTRILFASSTRAELRIRTTPRQDALAEIGGPARRMVEENALARWSRTDRFGFGPFIRFIGRRNEK